MKSIVSYPERGNEGNNMYRGNCSPHLVEDFVNQFQMSYLSDYMIGGGTTKEVCERRGIKGIWTDLRLGFDMMNDEIPDRPQNIFWHPPYHDMIIYSDKMYSAKDIMEKHGYDPRKNDLSRCSSWNDFVKKLNYCTMKQYSSLETGGYFGILMGDMKRKGKLYSMILDIIKPGTLVNIVIKQQNNCVSSTRSYNGKFIPIEHEYFLILKKVAPYLMNFTMTKNYTLDVRDSKDVTWKDLIAAVMENFKRPVTLEEIYKEVESFKRAKNSPNWKAKVRQVLQMYPIFTNVERGVWCSVA